MRVAHVVDRISDIGGVQTYLQLLLPALATRGIESVVVAAEANERVWAGAEVTEVQGLSADGVSLDADTTERLHNTLKDVAADVAFVHLAPSPGVIREVAVRMRTLVYAHDYRMVCPGNARYLNVRGAFCHEGPGLRCFWRAYSERCTNRRPDRLLRAYRRAAEWQNELGKCGSVLVASSFVAQVMEDGGVPRANVKVIPYPIDRATPTARVNGTDVLFLGRLIDAKGVHVLLAALALLPGVTAVIAGDGPARTSLEERAASLGLTKRVSFRGWVSVAERPTLLAGSRVLAFPSLWQEPFGLVGPEALAAGVPVVAADVGGISSWLDNGKGGLLVPPGDVSALAAALRRVLEDDDLHAELAKQGPDIAARFSIDRHLELLLPELVGKAS